MILWLSLVFNPLNYNCCDCRRTRPYGPVRLQFAVVPNYFDVDFDYPGRTFFVGIANIIPVASNDIAACDFLCSEEYPGEKHVPQPIGRENILEMFKEMEAVNENRQMTGQSFLPAR